MSRKRRDYFSRWFAVVWLLMVAAFASSAVTSTGPLRAANCAIAVLTGICAVRILASALGKTPPPPWFGHRG